MEFKNKNDYSVWFYDVNNNCIFYLHYVHSIYYVVSWFRQNKGSFYRISVCSRRSRRFIGTYFEGSFIPNKPR